MTHPREIYKCEKCGNIVEVLHAAEGGLFCCGQALLQMKANAVDAAAEKHVPVIESAGTTVTVTVGSVPHPMQQEHYIEFIELLTAARVYRVQLDPGKEPSASFDIRGDVLYARAYCNLHGLWKSS